MPLASRGVRLGASLAWGHAWRRCGTLFGLPMRAAGRPARWLGGLGGRARQTAHGTSRGKAGPAEQRLVVVVEARLQEVVGGRGAAELERGQLGAFGAHEHLVLADAHLLSIHNAGPLGPRSVSVIWMLLHVHLAQPRLFLVVRLLLRVAHRFPLLAQNLRYVRVVHVWTLLEDLPALVLGPNHEGVHGPLDVRLGTLAPIALRLSDDLGPKQFVLARYGDYVAPSSTTRHCRARSSIVITITIIVIRQLRVVVVVVVLVCRALRLLVAALTGRRSLGRRGGARRSVGGLLFVQEVLRNGATLLRAQCAHGRASLQTSRAGQLQIVWRTRSLG